VLLEVSDCPGTIVVGGPEHSRCVGRSHVMTVVTKRLDVCGGEA
jgi:hypothetical protein